MAEIEKLTGHGAPSVLLPGVKGQIYEDLDTGRLYECKGERGFIRVDGDDQCDEFNWVLKGVDISYNDLQDKPEQGGSTGGGRLDINATMTDSSTCTLDKTFEEIRSAYNGGMVVNVMMNGIILMPSVIQEGGINFIAFVDNDRALTIATVYVTPDNGAKYFMHNISH